jgi:hypothetical protein
MDALAETLQMQMPFYCVVVPHRPPIPPFPESAGPITTDHPLLVSLQSVLGSELSAVASCKLLVPKTSECASLPHTPVIATRKKTTSNRTSISHIKHEFILSRTMKDIPLRCQVTKRFPLVVLVLSVRFIQGYHAIQISNVDLELFGLGQQLFPELLRHLVSGVKIKWSYQHTIE